MEIKIGIVGEIVAGDETGSFIKVVDDIENTGGFLILTSSTPEMIDGFDNWVENEKSLSQYFIESGWVIRWP
ncbi:MAG: hypothetical protein Q8N35_08055 [Methylococcaceae bacterium]|nr:hypothetical protein [Methylococcaceae bacterium]MDZ4154954.1 hypothetical protein [Methylococcales bacterium]MDP2392419.1 hypothetical protein [Methylococcaceae bacterium]MDP3019525.1 hypothetical protein [Methylococcaceae bacterium]MDP3391884.1 hypothetical protein [Methylococcaceae bacterium]